MGQGTDIPVFGKKFSKTLNQKEWDKERVIKLDREGRLFAIIRINTMSSSPLEIDLSFLTTIKGKGWTLNKLIEREDQLELLAMLLLVLVEDSKDEAAIQGEGLASLRICLPEIKQKGTLPLLKAVSIFFAKLMSSGNLRTEMRE